MRILIADDEPTTLTFLEAIATRAGLEPTLARSGFEAWKTFNELRPRLVVTDWMMPGMTGVDLCRRIRASGNDGAVPYVIVVTTLSSRENVVEGFAAGADDYIVKPSDATEIRARLQVGVRAIGEKLAALEKTHRQVIEKCQNVIGDDHPDLLENLAALSDLYAEQRAFAKARAFLRRQIAIATKHGRAQELARLTSLMDDLRHREDATVADGTARARLA